MQELKALPVQRINRIRLEFKDQKLSVKRSPLFRINRIRLEFKVIAVEQVNVGDTGLIESDWNLKYFAAIPDKVSPLGLIESDWNLKDIRSSICIQYRRD